MSGPLVPDGYDVSKSVAAGRDDCRITVGFDKDHYHIPRFLVRLHYLTSRSPLSWQEIARFDHNETAQLGHDVYTEGLHIDVYERSGGSVTIRPRHGPLPENRGVVVRNCAEYLNREAAYFIDVFEGDIAPGGPPPWPDGDD
ncbi:DUF7718 family protein [Halosimplex marinum]|uniref:DUF7718 family protein n=1 Tax=Halosimplex marinum TaxID=3396620 RepID=UPI003F55F98C